MNMDKLVKLQESYNKITKCNRILKDDSCINFLKKLKAEFEEKKKKYIKIKNELESIKKLYGDINKQEKESDKKIKDDEFDLYNNAGSNFKLIENLEKRIQENKLELKEIENKEINLLEKDEKLSAEKEKLRLELIKLREEFNKYKEEVTNKINNAKQEFKASKEEIKKLEEDIEESLLKEFKNIQSKKVMAVAQVRDGVCLGCSMKVSSQTIDKLNTGKQIIYCDNCGRILYK